MIQLRSVDIGYDEVLFRIEDMKLEKGKTYALIGANGKGKSTFIKTLLGEIPSLHGEILIGETDLKELSQQSLAKLCAFVPSKCNPPAYMTAHEFVALGRTPFLNRFGSLKDNDRVEIEKSMDLLEIQAFRSRFMDHLSDGERQLIAIAKAHTQNGEYVFLDEPTAFLDYANKRKVNHFLNKIKEQNACVIYSTHDLELALQFADALLCLDPKNKQLHLFEKGETKLEKLIETCFP